MRGYIYKILVVTPVLLILNLTFFIPNTEGQNWIQSNIYNSSSAWKWINPYPSNKTLYQTQFINENTGYSQIDYRIFRTTNGGNNWIVPGDTNVNSVLYFFENSNTGYKNCIGGIHKTTNGGINWIIFKENISNFSVYSMSSLPGNCFMYSGTYFSSFGPVASLWYTSNNGVN
jgi:photosystem II stability/assembly factor-like uncharacterized protein